MNSTRIKDFGIKIGSFPSGEHNNMVIVPLMMNVIKQE